MAISTRITNVELVQICSAFLRTGSAGKTADECNRLWTDRGSNMRINQKQVYPAFTLAVERGLVSLTPPPDLALERRIETDLGLPESTVRVASAARDLSVLAEVAAGQLVHRVRSLARDQHRKEVHIGFGAGGTSRLVAQCFAANLRMTEDLPRIVLHALTSGFDVEMPEIAPVSFFNFFRDCGHDMGYVGLFAPGAASPDQVDDVWKMTGAAEAMARRHEIDIIVTTLASASDPHGALHRFLAATDADPSQLEHFLGDVMYSPYDASGPARLTGKQAVALFKLDELVEFARRPHHHVMLISGPCMHCPDHPTRTSALRPLIANPKLRVWTELVLCLATAEELLRPDSARAIE